MVELKTCCWQEALKPCLQVTTANKKSVVSLQSWHTKQQPSKTCISVYFWFWTELCIQRKATKFAVALKYSSFTLHNPRRSAFSSQYSFNFRFEPMHVLSLGISRLLKECLLLYICNCYCTSPTMCYASSIQSTQHYMEMMFRAHQQFLGQTELQSAGKGLKIDFSKVECCGRLWGLIIETGNTGGFWGNWLRFARGGGTIFGEIVDICSRNSRKNPPTVVNSSYSGLTHLCIEGEWEPTWLMKILVFSKRE